MDDKKQNDNEVRKFVRTILDEKQLTGVDDEMKEKLVDDLSGRLEDQINRALIESLNDKQFAEFEEILKKKDVQAMKGFFENKPEINTQEIVTQTMANFRAMYLRS